MIIEERLKKFDVVNNYVYSILKPKTEILLAQDEFKAYQDATYYTREEIVKNGLLDALYERIVKGTL